MRKSAWKVLARRRIRELFAQAAKMFAIDPALSNRYVHLARKLAMRFKVRMPRMLKRRFCKHCYTYLVPSKNARVRVQNKKVIIFCQSCKKFTRIPVQKRSS
jgi:ribonuclease P protein subunit RPR2